MATKAIIPASLDESKPRAAPFAGVLVADGVGTGPADEDEGVEGLAPVALAYGDRISATEKTGEAE